METKEFILRNTQGMEVHVINYGGIVTKILVPDRDKKVADVVLGFEDPEDYQKHPEHPYFGCIIGRYGNRIAKGNFKLDGQDYRLSVNREPNHLHGGQKGFDKFFWDVKESKNQLTLSYNSKDGEEGYPGNLNVLVVYELTDSNEFKINYSATTDKPTPVNLTNHSYFNLSSDKNQGILNHELMIQADHYTAVDQYLTPTGELRAVIGTEMDFTKTKVIGKDIKAVKEGGGYDHNFVLRDSSANMKHAATLYEPESGRMMEIMTTEPGLQFYSGNFLNGKLTGKNGKSYLKNDGLCLETQHFPDSPNHSHFPSTILRPGETYSSHTVYKFSVK